jgi:REP element-mobilizing transposase RayT
MADTYRKVYLHVVFAVKNRDALLDISWRNRLFAYTSKMLSNRGHFALAVNGYQDHVHMFFDYSCKELIEDLVREVKKSMSNFIKENNLCNFHFQWQSGYAVFSVGYREKDKFINYIKNQDTHHAQRTFKDEYMSLLESYEIEFKNEYVFKFLND